MNTLDLVSLMTGNFTGFVLVLVRLSGIFIFDPIYGSRNIPGKAKIALALMLSFAVFPLVRERIEVPVETTLYALAILKELTIGAVLGYAVSLVFAGIQFGGQLISFNIGLSVANVFDPMNGTPVTLIGRFKYLLATIIFLSMNGHHWVIEAICRSYDIGSHMVFPFSKPFAGYLVNLAGNMFVIALKIGAPVTVTMLLVNAALGILARTMPQMNVFIVGFPLQIAVGLITMSLSLFIMVAVMSRMFVTMRGDLYVLMQALLR